MSSPATSSLTLAAIDAAWTDLLDAIDAIPPSAQTTPGAIGDWSVVDLMRHLAAWNRATITRAGAVIEMSSVEIDAFNAASLRHPLATDRAAARAELVAAHSALLVAITPALQAGDVTAGICACGQEGIADHYASHAADLRARHPAPA